MRTTYRRHVITFALLLTFVPFLAVAAPVSDQLNIPNGEILSFSPDGQWLLASHPIRSSAGDVGSLRASLQADDDEPKLCVYAFPSLTPRACTAPGAYRGDDGPRGIAGTVAWSSDSDSIAFSEGSVRINSDGDIWQMETSSGQLTNLTDDGFTGQFPLNSDADSPIFVDTDPAYAPNGESIAFARMTIGAEGRPIPSIARLDLSTGEITELASLEVDPYQRTIGKFIWSSDSSTIWFTTTGLEGPVIGLFSVEASGSPISRISKPNLDDRQELVLQEIDPSGSYAIVALTAAITRLSPPYYALIDLKTGEETLLAPTPTSAEVFVYDALFAPDGALIIAIETPGENNDDDLVHIVRRDVESGAETILATDLPNLNFSPFESGLTFVTEDLLAYPTRGDEETDPWTIVSLSGANPIPATPASAFLPGSTVITTADIALRATPSVTGAIAQALTTGTELTIIDLPVEVDGVTWIPVRQPVSGALGYVPSTSLVPSSS